MTRELEATVFVVDNDAPTLKNLETLLKSVRLRTETYLSAEEFFRNYDPSRPGCLILEIHMPGMGGMQLYQRLREEGHGIPVIFLTGRANVSTAVGALRAGAFDFLEKPANHQCLIDRACAAITQDRENRCQMAQQQEIARRFQSLSPRELAVLNQIIAGHTSKTIARNLGIGVTTVGVHRSNIMRKVGAATSTDLLYLVLQSGHSREHPFSKGQDDSMATI
jgi:FixJ family two-component response regulator